MPLRTASTQPGHVANAFLHSVGNGLLGRGTTHGGVRW